MLAKECLNLKLIEGYYSIITLNKENYGNQKKKNNLKNTAGKIKFKNSNCHQIHITPGVDILTVYSKYNNILKKYAYPQRDDYLNAISYYSLVSYINKPSSHC